MEFIRIFKLKNNDSQFKPTHISIIGIGSAENRMRDNTRDTDCDDIPHLLNSDGTIYDDTMEPSGFENIKNNIFDTIEKISYQKSNNFSYLTVDPAYTNNSKKLDDINYRGHVSSLFHNLTIDETKDCNIICIIGCYSDFFDDTNISKIIEILKKNNGYLLICDTVPYKTSYLFNSTFQIV
jgi:hypothetical protein